MIEARGLGNWDWDSRGRNNWGLSTRGRNKWGLHSWGHNDCGRRNNWTLNGPLHGANSCDFPLGVRTNRVCLVSDHDGPRVGRPNINHATGATCALTDNKKVREHWRYECTRGDGGD
jgi:hypothetical protein